MDAFPMNPLFAHFAAIGGLFMLVNLFVVRARMKPLVEKGELTRAEADRFCLGVGAVIVVSVGLFEVYGLATGKPPFCQLLLPLGHRSLLPLHAIALAMGAALLYWVWRRGGDAVLAKVGPAFARVPDEKGTQKITPQQMRVRVTALLAIAWGGYAILRLTMPLPTPAEMPFCVDRAVDSTAR
jgi:hypothetical protein